MYKKKVGILVILSMFTILICTAVTFASVLFRSFVESEGTITTGSVDKIVNINDANESPVQISSSTQNISFNKAGDSTTLTVQVNNNIASVVQYKYEFAFSSIEFQTESFASCILVYFNGEFIDTLGDICASASARVANGYIDFSGYVNKATSDAASSVVDTLTFELHTASDLSTFNNSNAMSFKLRVYAQTADYEHNMFVSTESELKKAFNDLNLGVLPEDEKIVLFNNITLSSDFDLNYPVQIDLNGYKLDINGNLTFKGEGTSSIFSSRKMSISSLDSTGSIKVNNSKGILDIQDFYNSTGANIGYLYSDLATATSYDSTLLSDLVEYRVANKLRYGIKINESINLFGGLTFYNLSVTPSNNLTYSKPNLSVKNSVDYNDSESITIAIGSNLKIGVKILCTENDLILADLLANELKHLADLSEKENGNLKRTNAADLFLPTSIKSKNVTIEWVSSDESLISNTGIVSSNISGDATLTIYAHININDEVITQAFTIKTMSQNHETIFQYFVAQLSPIEMEKIFTGSNQSSSYYYLPIVDSDYDPIDNSSYTGYDYRATYKTPSSTETYTWEGFNNVGFEYITYTPISTYSFVSLEQIKDSNNIVQSAAVYLNSATFQSFAQVQVSAKFAGDEEVYTAPVNLIVKLGYSTELNELVFNKVNEDLSEINVLQNILNTRMANGMKNEKGDFYLDGSYQTYKISYAIPEASRDAISRIEGYAVDSDGNPTGNPIQTITGSQQFSAENISSIGKYKICLNTEKFDTSDSNFGVNVILSMPGVDETASRILYFKCPGIIKNDDTGFANMSVFNSVKYQVYSELCTISSEQGTDDVEDENYTVTDNASFAVSGSAVSGSTVTNYTGAYILRHDANLCTKLAFSLAETNTNTDNHIVYGLAKLIDWATGTDSTTTFGTYFNGILDSSFISDYSSVKSNGLTYLTEDEINIVRDYYATYISATNVDTIMNEVSYTETGRIVKDYTSFDAKVRAYINGSTSTYGSTQGDNNTYIKIQEIYQWATYDMPTTNGIAPDMALLGSGDWNIDIYATSYTSWTNTAKRNNGSYTKSKIYRNRTYYVQDTYETINDIELEVYIVGLLNMRTTSSSAANDNCKQFVYNLIKDCFVKPSYFTETGIAELINQAYIDLERTVSYDGFTSELKSFSVANDPCNAPTVTSFDYSTIGFDYFPNLKTLYIVGDYSKLKAFHTEKALMNCFNRIINNNDKLENIAFEYCSDSSMDFSLKNIYNANNLKKINLYHNLGITNIGALLKLDLSQLTYVDVADINLKFDYFEFVLQAINYKATHPIIFYQPDNTTSHSTYTIELDSNAEGLIYLEEFYEMIGENSSLTEAVYVGNNSQTIQWKIETGNGITYINGSDTQKWNIYNENYMTFSSVNSLPAKYYYCSSSFGDFIANHIYKVYDLGNGTIGYYDLYNEEVYVSGNTVPTTVPTDIQTALMNDVDTIEEYDTRQLVSEGTKQYGNWSTGQLIGDTSYRYYWVYDSDGNLLRNYDAGQNRNFYYSRRQVTQTNTYVSRHYPSHDEAESGNYYYIYNNQLYEVSYKYTHYDGNITVKYETITITYYEYRFYYRNTNNYIASTTVNNTFSYVKYSRSNNASSAATYNRYSDSQENITNSSTSTETPTSGYTITSNLYISYVQNITSTNVDTIENSILALNKYISKYTGSTINTMIEEGIEINYNISNGNYFSLILNSYGYTIETYNANNNYSALILGSICNEANTHLSDQAFGLYYHEYYAYDGLDCELFKNGNVYILDINSSGKFYWTQSSNVNERTFETIDGITASNPSTSNDDRLELFAVLTSATQEDSGKIYFYTGKQINDGSPGTNEFFQLVYNNDTGILELKRFGVLDHKFYAVSTSGDYNDWYGAMINATPTANETILKVICNQMAYVDGYFLTNSKEETYYRTGTGGTRQAVLTAVITVNGQQYERKFVINVNGLL